MHFGVLNLSFWLYVEHKITLPKKALKFWDTCLAISNQQNLIFVSHEDVFSWIYKFSSDVCISVVATTTMRIASVLFKKCVIFQIKCFYLTYCLWRWRLLNSWSIFIRNIQTGIWNYTGRHKLLQTLQSIKSTLQQLWSWKFQVLTSVHDFSIPYYGAMGCIRKISSNKTLQNSINLIL